MRGFGLASPENTHAVLEYLKQHLNKQEITDLLRRSHSLITLARADDLRTEFEKRGGAAMPANDQKILILSLLNERRLSGSGKATCESQQAAIKELGLIP